MSYHLNVHSCIKHGAQKKIAVASVCYEVESLRSRNKSMKHDSNDASRMGNRSAVRAVATRVLFLSLQMLRQINHEIFPLSWTRKPTDRRPALNEFETCSILKNTR